MDSEIRTTLPHRGNRAIQTRNDLPCHIPVTSTAGRTLGGDNIEQLWIETARARPRSRYKVMAPPAGEYLCEKCDCMNQPPEFKSLPARPRLSRRGVE